MPEPSVRFRAMGSDIHLIVVDGPSDAIPFARRRIEQLEQRWSRFRPDSEISVLNAAQGQPVPVSADTRLLLTTAIEAWRLTGGAFDPTLLGALVAAGYDRSFEDLDDSGGAPGSLPVLRFDRPDCTDIVVEGDVAVFPAGLSFDPGGIGKGLAADLVITELVERGVRGACVNMGGDVRVWGAAPDAATWTISIDHPHSDEPVALVGLAGGAVATSSVLRRVWVVGGVARHHLLDPSTALPTTSDLALASVIAGTAWEAEVLAKAVLLRGSARAFDLLETTTSAVAVDHDGHVTASEGFPTFLGGVPLRATVHFRD